MSFKTGLCSVSFRKNTSEEILSEMKKSGLCLIEWGSDIHCPPEKAEELACLQKQYGIACSSYGTYFRLGIHNAEELKEYIKAAKLLGTDILRIWCGNKNSEKYSEEEKAYLFSEAEKAAATAEREGVVLCLECHTGTYTNTLKGAKEILAFVNSKSFMMYWQPNQFKSFEENCRYAKEIAPFVKNIHVFNWKEKERYPLRDAADIWRGYLSCFGGEQTLLLEFMPKDTLTELCTEAKALMEITGE